MTTPTFGAPAPQPEGDLTAPNATTATFSGGVGAVRTTQADGGQPNQRLDINIAGSGSTFSADQVRALIGQINEQVGDGVSLAFSG